MKIGTDCINSKGELGYISLIENNDTILYYHTELRKIAFDHFIIKFS